MASIWTGLTRSIGCIPMCEIAGDEQEAIERKTACTARNQEALADWEAFPFKLEAPPMLGLIDNCSSIWKEDSADPSYPFKLVVRPPPNKCGYMDHREGCDCRNDEERRKISKRLAEYALAGMNALRDADCEG